MDNYNVEVNFEYKLSLHSTMILVSDVHLFCICHVRNTDKGLVEPVAVHGSSRVLF